MSSVQAANAYFPFADILFFYLSYFLLPCVLGSVPKAYHVAHELFQRTLGLLVVLSTQQF